MLKVMEELSVNAVKEKDPSSFTELIQMNTFVISRQFVGRIFFFLDS